MHLCQLDLKVHQKMTKETHTVIPLKELVSKSTSDLLLKATPIRCAYHLDVSIIYLILRIILFDNFVIAYGLDVSQIFGKNSYNSFNFGTKISGIIG